MMEFKGPLESAALFVKENAMNTPTKWKTPTTLAEMKMRADVIGGEIKQADADVETARKEAEALAKKAQDAATLLDRKVDIATDKRAERASLAKAMTDHVLALGEERPPAAGGVGSPGAVTVGDGATTTFPGEQAISPMKGYEDIAPKLGVYPLDKRGKCLCPPPRSGNYYGPNDVFICKTCGGEQ